MSKLSILRQQVISKLHHTEKTSQSSSIVYAPKTAPGYPYGLSLSKGIKAKVEVEFSSGDNENNPNGSFRALKDGEVFSLKQGKIVSLSSIKNGETYATSSNGGMKIHNAFMTPEEIKEESNKISE